MPDADKFSGGALDGLFFAPDGRNFVFARRAEGFGDSGFLISGGGGARIGCRVGLGLRSTGFMSGITGFKSGRVEVLEAGAGDTVGSVLRRTGALLLEEDTVEMED